QGRLLADRPGPHAVSGAGGHDPRRRHHGAHRTGAPGECAARRLSAPHREASRPARSDRNRRELDSQAARSWVLRRHALPDGVTAISLTNKRGGSHRPASWHFWWTILDSNQCPLAGEATPLPTDLFVPPWS